MEKIKQNAFVKKVGLNRILLTVVLVVMYFAFGSIVAMQVKASGGSYSFFTVTRLLAIMDYAYFLGFLSLGVTFVIATGGIDFSIGPVMFCCSLISGYTLTIHGIPMVLALIMSIAIGMFFGLFNGYMVSYWNIPPFIVSMATMNIAKGISTLYTKSETVSWPSASAAGGWYKKIVQANGIPVGLFVFLAIAVICAVVLNQTKAGRYILCLGSNEEAVRLSGVDVKKWKMLAYTICGILVGIASVYFSATFTTVQPGGGDVYNNEAIAGCVMGGTSMVGGLASISGTVIGVFIIALLQQGIFALGFSKDYQYIITGLIVIAAVYVDVMVRRRKN